MVKHHIYVFIYIYWYRYIYIHMLLYTYIPSSMKVSMNKRHVFPHQLFGHLVVQKICWMSRRSNQSREPHSCSPRVARRVATGAKPTAAKISLPQQQQHHHQYQSSISIINIIIIIIIIIININQQHHQDSVEGRMTPREIASFP